jgi:hypothetical protein
LFRQSVFARLTGYEDVNDAERLRHDPAIRWIVAQGTSPSQMGRFETQWRAAPENVPHVLATRFIGLPAGAGQHFLLNTGTPWLLGYCRDIPAVRVWNVPLVG